MDTTRRDFLAATGAAALAAGAYAAGPDTIRVGVIGCGGRGAGAALNATNADPGVRITALCDLFEDRIRAKRASLKQKRPKQVAVADDHCFAGFDGYRKLIASVDVVLIAIAPKFHAAYARAAIEAGKHVFLEKPHAIDPPGLRDLIAANEMAKRKKLSIVSGLYCRYEPGFKETIEKVGEGAIGTIVAVEERMLRGPYRVAPRVPGQSELMHQLANWHCFGWLSGDDLPIWLIHNFDRANWAMGDVPVERCQGVGGRSSEPEPQSGSLFDHHAVVCEYPNGVPFYVFARAQPSCERSHASIVFGTKGRCDLAHKRIRGEVKWRFRQPRGPRKSTYDLEHEALFGGIRSGRPVNNGDFMVSSSIGNVMAQVACYTGRGMTREECLKSDFTFGPKPEACSFDMDPPVRPDENGIYPVPIPGSATIG
jgi:predicted dehydrogenase